MGSGSSTTLVVEVDEEHGLLYPAVTTFTFIDCPGIHVLLLIKIVFYVSTPTAHCSLERSGQTATVPGRLIRDSQCRLQHLVRDLTTCHSAE